MRRALLSTAALVAGGLIVPAAIATTQPAAATPAPIHYQDASVAGRPSVQVSGTVIPIESDAQGGPGAQDQYVLDPGDGTLVPVSLDLSTELNGPAAFSGRVALGTSVARQAGVAPGEQASEDSDAGRTALDAAGASATPLAVQSADVRPAATAATAGTTAHRLYVAVITNRGSLASDATIAGQVDAMRSYWQTESDGHITSFTQPSATVRYESQVAGSVADGCGLGNAGATWNEAADKFPGVSFSGGNHLMVLVSDECSGSHGAGIGTVGSSLSSGGRSIVSLGSGGVQIGVHELGHNLSLQHANAELCATTCSVKTYWDLYSIMGLAITGGTWTPPSLDTAYRVQEGIASDAEVPTVTASTTVHLAGRGTSDGVRGFVVDDPASGAKYVVEYRSGTGRDATAFYTRRSALGSFSYAPGVVVERVESDRETTLITRNVSGKYATSFAAGGSYTTGSLRIDVQAAAPATGADVRVTLPGAAEPTPSPSTDPTTAPPTTAPPTTPPSTPPTSPPSTGTFTPGTPQLYGRAARVGERIYASPGRWTPAPTALAYQWLADGRPITGATRPSLLLIAAQRGARISVRVTGSRDGYATASRTSGSTYPVAAGRFTARRPAITRYGHTLRARPGSWAPAPRFAYRWFANGRPLAHATAPTLRIGARLRGARITVHVTASKHGYRTATVAARSVRVR